MIENYDDVMREWSAPSLNHGCCNTVTINPNEELDRWAVQQVITVLANSDYYYTKTEVDYIIQHMHPGMTPEEVQAMINASIASKAEQADLEAAEARISAVEIQVRENTEKLLNVYTKTEVNSLLSDYLTRLEAINIRNNYSRVNGETLILNNELEITI